jgi:hypothetical protein
MLTDRDLDALHSYDGDRSEMPNTGPKRTAPGICPVCGDDAPNAQPLGDPTCGKPECREGWVRR